MPFSSQSQRALFHSALKSKSVRNKHGLKHSVVKHFVDADRIGHLAKRQTTKVSGATKRAIKRRRRNYGKS